MENFTQNENSVSSKGGSKPYERKIKINQINQKNIQKKKMKIKKKTKKLWKTRKKFI